MTRAESETGVRTTANLAIAAAALGAPLGGDIALAQPASTGDAVLEPVAPGPGLSVTLVAGAAPDYEGSDDYEPVPLWNLRVASPLVDDVGNENQFFAGALINYRFGSVGR